MAGGNRRTSVAVFRSFFGSSVMRKMYYISSDVAINE